MESNKNYQKNETEDYIDFPDVNRVVVAGDLIYDPPLRWTKRGVPVSNFVICTQPDPEIEEPDELRSRKCYVSVVVWAQKAVFCNESLRKGSSVMIIGELQSMPNFAPEKAYYPVQVNAKWIQVLEKTRVYKPYAVGEQEESGEDLSLKSATTEEETLQLQDTMTSDNVDIGEPLETDNDSTEAG